MALLKIKGLLLLLMATVIAPSPWVVLRGAASEPTLISSSSSYLTRKLTACLAFLSGGMSDLCESRRSRASQRSQSSPREPGGANGNAWLRLSPLYLPSVLWAPPLSSRPPIVPPPCHCPGPGLRVPLLLSDLTSEGSCFLLAVPQHVLGSVPWASGQ